VTTVEFDLTAEDFAAFNLRHASTSESYSRIARRSRMSSSVIVFTALVLFVGVTLGDLLAGIVTGTAGAVLIWFAFPWLWRRDIQRNLRRLSKGDGLGTPGRRILRVDDAGLHECGVGIELSTSWDGIERVDLAPDHVLVYYGPQAAIVVPRRVGPSQIEALLSELALRGISA